MYAMIDIKEIFMIKVIMMCGICGSGKTTYAKQKEKEEKLKKNKYEIDMCNGSIMDKLISFALTSIYSMRVIPQINRHVDSAYVHIRK